MNRLSPVLVNIQEPALINPDIMTKLFFLYLRYSKYLDDDFAADGRSLFGYFIENTERLLPYFWVVFESNTMRPAGFVYLDKISGDSNTLHSAEVSACFFKEFWGGFTYKSGRKFLKICFETLGLVKLKAQIYPQNFRVKTLLKKLGFKKEGYLKSETCCCGKLQDIEIYALLSRQCECGSSRQ